MAGFKRRQANLEALGQVGYGRAMRRRHRQSIVFGLAVCWLGLAGCVGQDLGLRNQYVGQSLLQPGMLPQIVRRDAYGDPVPGSVDLGERRFAYRAYHHGPQ